MKHSSLLTSGILLAVASSFISCDNIAQNRRAFLRNGAGAQTTEAARTSSHKARTSIEGAELPEDTRNRPSQIKHYEGYTVSFNRETGNPNWSAWELTDEETDGTSTRKNGKFWQDTDITGCVTTKDYTNSGYDRGHLCPAADMKWSAQAMSDCFSMANITPQVHELNAGAWSTLEKKCRLWAQRDGSLLIAAGPIYEEDYGTIADGKVRIPSAFFKVIVAPYAETPRGIAFIYPNAKAPGNMAHYAMSIDEAEHITGYDFFKALPDDVENMVESTFSFNDWIKGE